MAFVLWSLAIDGLPRRNRVKDSPLEPSLSESPYLILGLYLAPPVDEETRGWHNDLIPRRRKSSPAIPATDPASSASVRARADPARSEMTTQVTDRTPDGVILVDTRGSYRYVLTWAGQELVGAPRLVAVLYVLTASQVLRGPCLPHGVDVWLSARQTWRHDYCVVSVPA